MKSMPTQSILFAIAAICLHVQGFCQNISTLTVQIDNIEKPAGYMMVAVYNQADLFLSETMFKGEKHKVKQGGSMNVSLELPFGEYGISIFHDLNGNGELDSNLFKAPAEPIGFSNNAKATFGPPKYENVKFSFTEDQQTISIILN